MPKKIDGINERILYAATSLYHSEGLQSLSMRRVASESGLSVGSVYNACGDKETLIAQVLAEDIEALKGTMMESVFGKQPEEALYAVVLSFVERMMVEANNILKYVMDLDNQENYVERILRGACNQLKEVVQELVYRVYHQKGVLLMENQSAAIAEMALSMMQSIAQHGCGDAQARAELVFGMLVAYAGSQGSSQGNNDTEEEAEYSVVV